MDKDQTVEVIDLLEDIIGELSGSYVTGTGKDGIPKRLYQVIDYFNGKSTDAKERIFTNKELKAIADNKRAKAVVMKAYNVYNQRIEAGKNLQSRIYGCYSQKIPINGDVERANFEIASFERINSLNQEHFDHMSEQNCISCDEYMKIIESHINSLESVYLKELEDKITEFSQVHNSETVIKPELIGKYFGSNESNRISSNIRKQEAVNPIYKEYGGFLDVMDKATCTAQNKEKIPQKILAYKLQYLLTKTKIMDVVNASMKNIEADISNKKISAKTKKKNDAVIKQATAEIKELSNEYKDIIKAMKTQNKEDAKLIKKNQRKQKMLNAGKAEVLKASGITIEPILSENKLIKKFLADVLAIPESYMLNPVAYEAMYEYIQCYKESNHSGQDYTLSNIQNLKDGLTFSNLPDGIKFEYNRDCGIKLRQAIEIKINDGEVNITRENEESPDVEKVTAKSSKSVPKIFVHKDSRLYDKNTNIEMSRIFTKAKYIEGSKTEDDSCKNVYKRDLSNMHFVYKNNEKKPLDLSITSEDMATLDGALKTTYAIAESSRQTTIRAIVNSRMMEAKERSKMNKARGIKTKVPKESDVLAQVQKEVEESTIRRKVQESKFKAGFMKYPQYIDFAK